MRWDRLTFTALGGIAAFLIGIALLVAGRGRASAVRAGLRQGGRHRNPCNGQSRAAQAARRRAGKAPRAARRTGAGGNTVGRLTRPPTEYELTLHQADPARSDFAAIEDGQEFIIALVSKVPTRKELACLGCGRFLCERRSDCDFGESRPRPLIPQGSPSSALERLRFTASATVSPAAPRLPACPRVAPHRPPAARGCRRSR